MGRAKCIQTQVLTCRTACDLRRVSIRKTQNLLNNWTLKLLLDKVKWTFLTATRLADSSVAQNTIWINQLTKSTLCTPSLCITKQTSPKKALLSIKTLCRSRTQKRIFMRAMRSCMNTPKCRSRQSSSKVLMRGRFQKWREETQRRLRKEKEVLAYTQLSTWVQASSNHSVRMS